MSASATTARPRSRVTKDEKLNVRVTKSQKTVVYRAAEATGKTPAEYIISAIVERAERDTRASTIIQIAKKDQTSLMAALANRSPLPKAWSRASTVAKAIKSR